MTDDDPRALLGPLAVPPTPPDLAPRVLAAAAPLLAVHARRTSAWAWLRPLAVALVPLPLVVVANVAAARLLHGLLSAILPDALSTWLVAQHAVFVLLLLGASYAAVPLIADRQARATLEDAHG